MADASPAVPLSLLLIETGPDGGWCDAATGVCAAVASDQEGPPAASEATLKNM